MRRLAAIAVLLVACKIDLDHREGTGASTVQMECTVNTVSTLCTGADDLTDCSTPTSGCFTYIKEKIFDANCKSNSCHSAGGTGMLDLSTDPDVGPVSQAIAYANLMGPDGMGAPSIVDGERRIVVPGHPEQSYLEMMMQKLAPADMVPPASPPPKTVGYMPQANGVLCCQKLDLIDRWISGGALNN
jgi:hypothetical protein